MIQDRARPPWGLFPWSWYCIDLHWSCFGLASVLELWLLDGGMQWGFADCWKQQSQEERSSPGILLDFLPFLRFVEDKLGPDYLNDGVLLGWKIYHSWFMGLEHPSFFGVMFPFVAIIWVTICPGFPGIVSINAFFSGIIINSNPLLPFTLKINQIWIITLYITIERNFYVRDIGVWR